MAETGDAFEREFILTGGRVAAADAQREVLEAVERSSYEPASQFAIRLALEEALSNAFKHGNAGDPSKTIRLACRIDESFVEIEVEDEGTGFDPGAVPDPTLEENLEIPSGRGIVLMKSYMTDVEYNDAGNLVRMRFERSEKTSRREAAG